MTDLKYMIHWLTLAALSVCLSARLSSLEDRVQMLFVGF